MKTMKFRKMVRILKGFAVTIAIPLSICSCQGGRGGETKDSVPDTIVEDSINNVKVNIYIENSGSMDGFVQGLTDFKNDIGNLLVETKHFCKQNGGEVKLYFIHNNVQENITTTEPSCGDDIADVASWIDVEWFKDFRGNDTKLNNVFGTILEKTDSNTVSILISDCIYSIGKNGNTMQLLNHEKNTTKSSFLEKSNMKLATTIYRMLSQFNGYYFPYTGDANRFHFKGKLPYYICVFADNQIMDNFCAKVNISDKEKGFQGYDNRYSIAHSGSEEPYWTILPNTGKNGRFQTIRGQSSQNKVNGIEKAKPDRNGSFSFCVAIDMSSINVDEDYLLDTSNYILDNSRYVITAITPYNKEILNSSDLVIINKSSNVPTHIITIANKGNGLAIGDLGISLERKMPQWIDDFNIMDDTQSASLKNGGSFGLKYWIEGISRAYKTLYPKDDSYFNLNITIKK